VTKLTSVKPDHNISPAEGPRALTVPLLFTAASPYLVPNSFGNNLAGDLALEMESGTIDMVQSIYVDNSLNPNALTLQFAGLAPNHNLDIPPNFQGWFGVTKGEGILRWAAQSGIGAVAALTFYNCPMPLMAYGPQGVPLPQTNVVVNLAPAVVGDNVLVGSVANQTIKLYRLMLSNTGAAAVNIQFFSGPSASARPLTGLMSLAPSSQQPFVLTPSNSPWFSGILPGDSLVMTASAANNIGGQLGIVQS
jgi:hypothetical protein